MQIVTERAYTPSTTNQPGNDHPSGNSDPDYFQLEPVHYRNLFM